MISKTIIKLVPRGVAILKTLAFISRMSGQHYVLRWNNYQTNMTSVFHQLLQNEAFVDVTLACNDLSLKAHKVSIAIVFVQLVQSPIAFAASLVACVCPDPPQAVTPQR